MKKFRLSYLIKLVIALLAVCASNVYSQVRQQSDELVTKKILVLGDSLSAAYKMPVDKGWVSLLQANLASSHPEYEVVNASVSGATTAAGLSVLNNALDLHKPSIVLLALGANDGLQGKPISYIRGNLDKLIVQSMQAGAEVVLLGLRLPPNFGSRYTEPFFDQYGFLAEKYHLALLPFLLEGVAGKAELMMGDGLHPTIQAQPLILEKVWSVLLPVLDEL